MPKETEKNKIFAIILAGGSGTRLWPLSRKLEPKQFLKLYKKHSLFELTVKRASKFIKKENIIVLTSKLYASVFGQSQLKNFKLIMEPTSRNTAPAIGVASIYLYKFFNDPILVVLSSDHVVLKEKEFLNVLKLAVAEADTGKIITLGVVPQKAETGYGYIEVQSKPAGFNKEVLKVKRFVEKPDLKKATEYVKSGRFFWNSGMFIFKASTILNEIKKHMPEIFALLSKISEKSFQSQVIDYKAMNKLFKKMPNISIDYGIMEKSNLVWTIPSDIGWNDVGSWTYFYEISKKDKNNNVLIGDVISIDSKNNLLYSGSRLVAAIGINNLTLIETPDAILVSDKNRSQEVKKLYEYLKMKKRKVI